MKYLIAGLGNIGEEYDGTRHNVGFEVVDALASLFEVDFQVAKLGSLAEVRLKGKTLVLLKPSTFMNLSGKAIRYWLQDKRIAVDKLLVITDDVALPFGKLRLRAKGSDGGHNGLKNINALLETDQYPRLRIGIGSDFPRGGQVDYVLGKWTSVQNEALPDLKKTAIEVVKSFCLSGIGPTMTQFNRL